MIKRRKRNNSAPVIVVTVIIALVIVAILAFIGYDSYIRNSHPIKYEGFVERYSEEYGVDKFLVYAVIKTESGYRPDAVSNVGARGLMQIMETTFDWIKFKTGDDESVYYDMYDPQTNIKYGCWFLGYLYNEFGNLEAVAAAYHAGRGQVNEWLSDSRYSADGVHLDVIPTEDTAHYVSKITKAYNTYLRLYNQ